MLILENAQNLSYLQGFFVYKIKKKKSKADWIIARDISCGFIFLLHPSFYLQHLCIQTFGLPLPRGTRQRKLKIWKGSKWGYSEKGKERGSVFLPWPESGRTRLREEHSFPKPISLQGGPSSPSQGDGGERKFALSSQKQRGHVTDLPENRGHGWTGHLDGGDLAGILRMTRLTSDALHPLKLTHKSSTTRDNEVERLPRILSYMHLLLPVPNSKCSKEFERTFCSFLRNPFQIPRKHCSLLLVRLSEIVCTFTRSGAHSCNLIFFTPTTHILLRLAWNSFGSKSRRSVYISLFLFSKLYVFHFMNMPRFIFPFPTDGQVVSQLLCL